MNILIKNGRLVSPDSIFNADIWVQDDIIKSVAKEISTDGERGFDEIIDAGGKFILPGIVDAHTHYLLESRGTVTADQFYSASVAGAFGGVTTAVDFADQVPGKSLAETSRDRIEASEAEMAIDFGLHQCIFKSHEGIPEELQELRRLGVTTVKIFTTYKREGYYIGESGLKELFARCRDLELMVSAHCEDDDLIQEITARYEGLAHPPSLHPVLRPAEAEYRAVRMIGELAGDAKAPIYIVHLSSSRGYDAVRELREKGVRVGVETTPHYLLLDNSLLEKEQAQKYIMTPPLRNREDNEALWKAVQKGDVDIIATDHCTFTLEQKLQSDDCRTVLPGIPGTEELLPLIHHTGVNGKKIDLQRMVSLLSENPARFFGLYPRKGSLLEGSDADLVIFDPEKEYTISDESQHTAAGYTPYHGTEVKGMPILTMLRGKTIVRDGKFLGRAGDGRFIKAGSSSLFTS